MNAEIVQSLGQEIYISMNVAFSGRGYEAVVGKLLQHGEKPPNK